MRDLDHIRIWPLSSRSIRRFETKVDRSGGPDACWPWTASLRSQGYGRFNLGDHSTAQANRVAWAIANKLDPGQLFVCHTCDNRRCCNPAHLWLGTGGDNMADMVAKGRHIPPQAAGEKNGNAKLTEAQIETVKAMIRAGRTNVEIARPFGVTHQLISRIRRGKAWGSEPMTKRYASLKR